MDVILRLWMGRKTQTYINSQSGIRKWIGLMHFESGGKQKTGN